jgi:hypothetical protein
VNVKDFGASGDGITDDYAPFQAAHLKDNVVDVSDSGSDIDAVRIASHNWKSTAGVEKYGVIAQEHGRFAECGDSPGMTPKEITENVWEWITASSCP